jgi:hypothetical protein
MFRSILVLEAPWDAESVRSKSVWPFVSEFANAANLQAYHHIFYDKKTFCHWVKRFNSRIEDIPTPKLLYIAAHGTPGRIAGINGKTINETLRKARNISYVHFGSCLFGNEYNLESLLQTAKHIKWAAGYQREVDWIDATIFDIMLWRRIATREEHNKGKKFFSLANELISEVSGLAEKLDFRLQYRIGERKKTQSIRPAGEDN